MSHLPLAEWLLVELSQTPPDSAVPRYRSIYAGIRKAILNRRLAAGTRLPSTRLLAEELGMSRNTVVTAFDQLIAEGYVDATTGSGTYVADISTGTPAETSRTSLTRPDTTGFPERQVKLSNRGQRILDAGTGAAQEIQPFVPGMDDFSVFPLKIWQRLQNKYWRDGHAQLLDYGSAGGYLPLRQAIADYLRISRSVQVTSDQVLITSGTQQSLMLCAQMLASEGHTAWLEDPGYWGARKVFEACDLKLRPIAVDHEGINPSSDDLATSPRLIYVTPSHQYPTSAVMSLQRRQLLLELAASRRTWILEDDYDSEFRYNGRPLSSLQGLDTHNSVIYLGTFSKILYPGIKVGYMVVPIAVVDPLKAALYDLQRPGQVMLQAALADFIEQGHFATHVRKVRQVYGERRELLVRTLKPILGTSATLSEEASGMHLVIELPEFADDVQLALRATEEGLVVRPLSSYYLGTHLKKGLMVGYAYVPTERIAYFGRILGNVVKAGIR
jgi:GntR family transcriptional regulator/MocR family aminotransferase